MYKVVENFIDNLNNLTNVEKSFLEFSSQENCIVARDNAIKLLYQIYKDYSLSEEFVTAFTAYCNFFLLNGLHKVLGYDYGLDTFYSNNSMTENEIQYLEAIKNGIQSQDISNFINIVQNDLYGFGMPYVYIYILGLHLTCLLTNTVCENEYLGKLYNWIDYAEKNISDELNILIKKQDMTTAGLDHGGMEFFRLLPCLNVIKNPFAQILNAINHDLHVLHCESIENLIPTISAMKDLNFSQQIAFSSIFSRLDFLINTDSTFMIFPKTPDDVEQSILARRDFLNLPLTLSHHLIGINDSIKQRVYKERENEILSADRTKIINQFSHTYSGMRATSLHDIAIKLLENDNLEIRKLGRKVLYEYSIKTNLTKDVEMLKLRFESNISKLNNLIKSSIADSADSEDSININQIIDDALSRCTVTLVHDGSDNARRLRSHFKEYDFIAIRNSFESDVLLAEKKNMQSWFNKNLFHINYDISPDWLKILFRKDSYAAILLTDIITELIMNLCKYANKAESIEFTFSKSDALMSISLQNSIKSSLNDDYSTGGFGLDAERDAIKVLNEINGYNGSALITNINNGKFITEINITNTLFDKVGA